MPGPSAGSMLVTVLAVLLGLAGGAAAGAVVGKLVRGRPYRYWALNIVVLAACMAADFAGLVQGWPPLAFGALGVMGGALTGLKYGYSENIGAWRILGRPAGVEPSKPAEELDEAAAKGAEPAAGPTAE